MKKWIPYFIGSVILLLLIMVIMASRGNAVRKMDERITLRQRDKIPYGTAVARQLLPVLFSNANVQADARYPGSWESIDYDQPNQAVFLIADYFDGDKDELKRLSQFVEKGNTVFVVARAFSEDAANFFGMTFSGYYNYFSQNSDSLRLHLMPPSFAVDSTFTYPGKKYEGFIQKLDTSRALVLGKAENGFANFVQLKKGSGSFFLHTAPLAFSNYFILHKQNVLYFQHALSVLPKNTSAVLWNEYFLQKRQNSNEEKGVNWLDTLFKYPAFRWGLLTAFFTLLLYILLGMRRKQRMIPPHEKPKNDSLDFVKTLGRLYYDKRDHKNLAEKMGAYFLEHVRSTYKIASHTLDEEFVRTLHMKSGYPEPEIKEIITAIEQFPDWPNISEEKLARFYKQLELFYQNT